VPITPPTPTSTTRGVTVSVAARLVALPTPLLTTTL
jgi:hypothetical protein